MSGVNKNVIDLPGDATGFSDTPAPAEGLIKKRILVGLTPVEVTVDTPPNPARITIGVKNYGPGNIFYGPLPLAISGVNKGQDVVAGGYVAFDDIKGSVLFMVADQVNTEVVVMEILGDDGT